MITLIHTFTGITHYSSIIMIIQQLASRTRAVKSNQDASVHIEQYMTVHSALQIYFNMKRKVMHTKFSDKNGQQMDLYET